MQAHIKKKGRGKLPWRYRWPDDVRDDILARLLALNAERAERERLSGPALGPGPKGKGKGKGPKATKPRQAKRLKKAKPATPRSPSPPPATASHPLFDDDAPNAD